MAPLIKKIILNGESKICVLSASQVVASAMSRMDDKKELSISQLVRYNNILLDKIADYYCTIDLDDLYFEFSSIAPEFVIAINENYERVIQLNPPKAFNYSIYMRTFPENVVNILEGIEVPS